MQKTKQQFQEHYRKRFPESKEKFQIEYEWLKGYDMKQIMQLGIAFHFLPARYNYVQMPEDYWWTSLKEYELRYHSGIIRPEIFNQTGWQPETGTSKDQSPAPAGTARRGETL